MNKKVKIPMTEIRTTKLAMFASNFKTQDDALRFLLRQGLKNLEGKSYSAKV